MNNVINAEGMTPARLNSLATDNIWGGSSWKTDMEEALQKGTYSYLGIDDGDFEDPTPNDNKITPEDAAKITAAIMKDENLLKDTLGDYYTRYAKSNYDIKSGKYKSEGDALEAGLYQPTSQAQLGIDETRNKVLGRGAGWGNFEEYDPNNPTL